MLSGFGASFLAAQGTGIRLFFHLSYIRLALRGLSAIWAWLNLRGLDVERQRAAGDPGWTAARVPGGNG